MEGGLRLVHRRQVDVPHEGDAEAGMCGGAEGHRWAGLMGRELEVVEGKKVQPAALDRSGCTSIRE